VTAMEGLAHSIHARLVVRSKELGMEGQLLLERYALHRFLFRLSKSIHADRFLLKGAQLMLIWIGETARSTRDADLLEGSGSDRVSCMRMAVRSRIRSNWTRSAGRDPNEGQSFTKLPPCRSRS
jgi:predicted nucleotidyltransferase component of viral defense system